MVQEPGGPDRVGEALGGEEPSVSEWRRATAGAGDGGVEHLLDGGMLRHQDSFTGGWEGGGRVSQAATGGGR